MESVNLSAQDAGLDDLVKKMGSGDTTPPAGAAQLVDPAADLEIYKRLCKPVCLLGSWGIDKVNRRFLKCEFMPMTEGQIAMVEDDLAYVLKDALDKILPDMAKKNPRLVSLAMIFGMIYASNTRKIEPANPADQEKQEPEPVKDPSTITVTI